ncbi:MAG: hypothetical protein MI757_06350, partial [Pirellulales bacterium]|nr:hypothetical protein [Pirellulales bacterium]
LAEHFLVKTAIDSGLPHKRLSHEATQLLAAYDWPGNVRELQHLLERAVVFSQDDVLGVDAFPQLADVVVDDNGEIGPRLFEEEPVETEAAQSLDQWPTLDDVQRDHIARTLEATGFNRSAAARALGVDRKVLARKIKKYGIEIPVS